MIGHNKIKKYTLKIYIISFNRNLNKSINVKEDDVLIRIFVNDS